MAPGCKSFCYVSIISWLCVCAHVVLTQAQRTIKGILNKLTPEKFERLLQQLLEVITTADLLKHTISLVFENAVEQPTYCAM